jgi:hypothetical protein
MTKKIQEQVAGLNLFDANVWMGPPEGFPLAREVRADTLAPMLEEYFIREALVSHWHSRIVNPQDGNRALTALESSLTEKCGVIWTGLPLLAGESDPLPGRGSEASRLRGVRVFPKAHQFPLTDWMLGPLCEWMIERHLPLFVWHTETDWPSIRSFARSFPRLPLVVESQPRKIVYHLRPLSAILRDCPNVRMETSNFIGQGFVEYAVREFGAERLIFGSFLPVSDPWAPIGMLLDADISESEKRLIAGDNLRKILAEIRRRPRDLTRRGRGHANAA